jgi:hypothetical protein
LGGLLELIDYALSCFTLPGEVTAVGSTECNAHSCQELTGEVCLTLPQRRELVVVFGAERRLTVSNYKKISHIKIAYR